MKRNTIKWRLFKTNLLIILLLISIVTIIFNLAVRFYIQKDIIGQLNKTAVHTEDTAMKHGPDFFSPSRTNPPPPPPYSQNTNNKNNMNNEIFHFYFMLDKSLRDTLSVINADYILFNTKIKIITPPNSEINLPLKLQSALTDEISSMKKQTTVKYLRLNISNIKYVVLIKPVFHKNTFGLGWIVIYSNLEKISQLQLVINSILFVILIISAFIIMFFANNASKKISEPIILLNSHIKAIADRNFGEKIEMKVDDELKDIVSGINNMSIKLESYDKAQKTFLQNISHEFRTPLMSIQSYAEGIKYNVVDTSTSVDVIIAETKRMTSLVEDLLYLSRLDSIEENYHYEVLFLNNIILDLVERINGIAINNNIKIITHMESENVLIYADEEKVSRAITNVLSNCIRYAKSSVKLELKLLDMDKALLIISDDGPGIESHEVLNIFDRFYKGKKGKTGLGLAISKNVIDKHNGTITAESSEAGAVFKIEFPTVKF